jgi:hypothetical protein
MADPIRGYWRLVIETCGRQHHVHHHDGDVLKHAQKEWEEYEALSEIEQNGVDPILRIEGFTDSYDRGPIIVSVRKESIAAIVVIRMA